MELTDEQYSQVIRYVDNEMDAGERQAFEDAVNQIAELYNEVNLYKEIRLLGDSVDKKIMNACDFITATEISKDEEVRALLDDARLQWETEHEDIAKQRHVITPHQLTIVQSLTPSKIKKINKLKWLAAAVFTGFVCLSVVWWNVRNTQDNAAVIISKKAVDSTVITSNKKVNTETIPLPTDTPSTTPSHSDDRQPNAPANTNYASASKREQEKKYRTLFNNNFQPDSTPDNLEGLLEEPMNLYADKNYKDAIANLEMVKDASESRGKQLYDTLTLFHIHYYIAQSYLASGSNITTAITELKRAITVSPDILLITKAEWYLSLAYMKRNEIRKAEGLLKKIIVYEKNGEYKQKAMKLLKDIRNLGAN